ncbi:MAG TPA: hypothetical protein PLV43_06555 [Aequorivita sp.]|nr:hypothetical protein [Aequorivita sp.]
MKRQTYILPSSSNIIKALNRKRQPYQIEYTSNTTTIKADDPQGRPVKYLCSDRGLNIKDLGFVQKVKSYVEKLEKPQVNVLSRDIEYFKFNDLEPGFYEGVSELDINKAYWITAYKLGYLSKEIYEQGLTVDKMTRLISWGAIAATKRIYTVNEKGERKYKDEICNKVTRSYFFDVAHELGIQMAEVLEVHRKSVLFYWVDAFFIQGRSAPAIIEKEMRLKGLPVKNVPLWHIHVQNKNEFSDLITVTTKGGKEKPFHRKKGNRQEFQFMEYCSILAAAPKK